ncbi:MAG TPA: metallophosphoesterase [Polyangiaceae bacterium]
MLPRFFSRWGCFAWVGAAVWFCQCKPNAGQPAPAPIGPQTSSPQPSASADRVPSPELGSLPSLKPIPVDQPFSFVVLGDNRGEEGGKPRPVFLKILAEVNQTDARFVLSTGDMIAGYSEDPSATPRQWQGYQETLRGFKVPTFPSPGNHDIWNAESGRLYRKLWGPTYYAFDYGSARFISLDTESEPSRIGGAQLEWLTKQLRTADKRQVFLYFHKPLFPVDGHVGSSLDEHPEQRDRLHQLLVQHRAHIKAVFQGHEHLYSHEERDGIHYYITGGAGANLYAPREQGGYHHFLLVQVKQGEVKVDLRKVGDVYTPPPEARVITPGTLLEGWEDRVPWGTWDDSVRLVSDSQHHTRGKLGGQLRFDFALCQWPLMYGQFKPERDFSGVKSLVVDVFVPGEINSLTVAPHIPGKGEDEKYEAPKVPLKPGWNTVRTDLDGGWLDQNKRRKVGGIEWMLQTTNPKLAGWVVFDNFRAERVGGAPIAIDDWENVLGWNPWNSTVTLEYTREAVVEGRGSAVLRYDLKRWSKPVLYASLPARWDLSKVAAMQVKAFLPKGTPERALELSLVVASAEKHRSPAVPLGSGWNTVRVPLEAGWLPREVRSGATEVEWVLSSAQPNLSGWMALDDFRAVN